MNIETKVRDLIQKEIEDAGYILDEVLYVKEEGNYFLRIVIDANKIIEIEDCVIVSKIINPILDEADLIEESYVLDVCSKEKGCE
jgi:ribosome maturation factor RimP